MKQSSSASKGISELKIVDTNIFVQYLFNGERADEAKRLLASYPDLTVTVGIIDEVEFVIIGRLARERLGIRKLSKLKEHIRTKGLDFVSNIKVYSDTPGVRHNCPKGLR